jgi:hypothetical protein
LYVAQQKREETKQFQAELDSMKQLYDEIDNQRAEADKLYREAVDLGKTLTDEQAIADQELVIDNLKGDLEVYQGRMEEIKNEYMRRVETKQAQEEEARQQKALDDAYAQIDAQYQQVGQIQERMDAIERRAGKIAEESGVTGPDDPKYQELMETLGPMREEWEALEAQRNEKEAAVRKMEEGVRKVEEDRDRKRQEAESKAEAAEKQRALTAAQDRLEEMKYQYEAIQQAMKYQQ